MKQFPSDTPFKFPSGTAKRGKLLGNMRNNKEEARNITPPPIPVMSNFGAEQKDSGGTYRERDIEEKMYIKYKITISIVSNNDCCF